MPDYGTSHDSTRHDRGNVDLFAMTKAFVGTMLIVIGVILGLYVAITVFHFINGDEAPTLIGRIAKPMAEKAIHEAEAQAAGGAQPFDLSPDIKQAIFCLLTFMFMLIPVTLATCLIGSGVKLMQSDATEALTRIAQHLKKPS